jgi:hypothetical protein
MNAPLRHRCRNPRCKLKLSAPVENEHHAFCCRGCYVSFYPLALPGVRGADQAEERAPAVRKRA